MGYGARAHGNGAVAVTGENKIDFFVSYTGKDPAWAEWIAWHLTRLVVPDNADETGSGHQAAVFLQHWDILAGDNFVAKMHSALNRSVRVLPVLTERYLIEAKAGNAEWQAVWSDDPDGVRRRVVPVRVEDVEPPGLLRTLQHIDLVGLGRDEAVEKLLGDIYASIAGRARPPCEPPFPGITRGGGPAYPGRARDGRRATGDQSTGGAGARPVEEPAAPVARVRCPGTSDAGAGGVITLTSAVLADLSAVRTWPDLAAYLDGIHRRSGMSLTKLEIAGRSLARTGQGRRDLPTSTVSDALNGKRRVKRDLLESLLAAWQLPPEERGRIVDTWERINATLGQGPPMPDGSTRRPPVSWEFIP